MTASSTAKVNGPEDDLDGWGAIDWRTHEDNVRRLRCREGRSRRGKSSGQGCGGDGRRLGGNVRWGWVELV
jgi:hypothetical protein